MPSEFLFCIEALCHRFDSLLKKFCFFVVVGRFSASPQVLLLVSHFFSAWVCAKLNILLFFSYVVLDRTIINNV